MPLTAQADVMSRDILRGTNPFVRRQETMSCPLEGVQTLMCTSDEIVAAAHAARRASRDEGDDSRPARAGAISSDDLLPLFIAALVQVSWSTEHAHLKLRRTATWLLTF